MEYSEWQCRCTKPDDTLTYDLRARMAADGKALGEVSEQPP
jgi:hypothetical protein